MLFSSSSFIDIKLLYKLNVGRFPTNPQRIQVEILLYRIIFIYYAGKGRVLTIKLYSEIVLESHIITLVTQCAPAITSCRALAWCHQDTDPSRSQFPSQGSLALLPPTNLSFTSVQGFKVVSLKTRD